MNHFVGVSQEDCFLCTLPLLDVAQRLVRLRSLWHVVFGEVEFKRLELLIPVKVALEVLQQHNLLVYRFWIVKEVELLDVVAHGVCVLRVVCR